MATKPKAYIILPGSVTGDLWHLAAAQILSRKDPKAFKCDFVTVVAVVGNAKLETKEGEGKATTEDASKIEKEAEDQKKRKDTENRLAAISFNYLRNIGLDCCVALVDGLEAGMAGSRMLEPVMFGQTRQWFDDLFARQDKAKSFEEILGDLETSPERAKHAPDVGEAIRGRKMDEHVLPLMTATTIAMKVLLPPDSRAILWRELSHEMSTRNGILDKSVDTAATNKFDELKRIIAARKDTLKEELKEKYVKPSGVLLFNYRINTINKGTNSTPQIFQQVEALAKKNGLILIKVAAGMPPEAIREGIDFDIFDRLKGVPPPGIEARVTARFWSMVADDEEIVGMVGGRSGSIDVAGFNRVRCLFFDEPWLQLAAGNEAAANSFGKTVYDLNKDADTQIPQCLRSLQLYPIIAVGLPEYTAEKDWQRIEEYFLLGWLKDCLEKKHRGEIFPKFEGWKTSLLSNLVRAEDERKAREKVQNARGGSSQKRNPSPVKERDPCPKPLEFYRTMYLERRSLGVNADALDAAGYVDQ
ncbi:MAG: hypothetical protein M1837_006336 [Sclerophora amabilis]|nr:MAG: hypothetical protein M1837_006336 [Sclerophora amabilis]